MLPFQAVAVFIQAGAVKLQQALLVLAEMGGHPVQKHRQARPVEPVHQVLEVLGGAIAGGGGEIPRTLIAPGIVQGILRHGHQLHRGVAHVHSIPGQLIRQLAVVKGTAVGIAPPGARMHLVNIQRSGQKGLFSEAFLPGAVLPGIVQRCQLAVRPGAGGGVKGVGIRFPHGPSVRPGQAELIAVVILCPGDKALPHAVRTLHGEQLPAGKVPGQAHRPGVGRPQAETEAAGFGMRPEPVRRGAPGAAVKCRCIHLCHLLILSILSFRRAGSCRNGRNLI